MKTVNPPTRTPLRLAMIGIGKIARDQHLPAVAKSADFTLSAVASRNTHLDGALSFPDFSAMIAAVPNLQAVSICTPPEGRHHIARAALDAGLHVMLEKPPGSTVTEVLELARHATEVGKTLFTTWHSREAAGVEAARTWLTDSQIKSVKVDWKEDVRVWHPGQDWIFEAGGLGVFDPGINALSIMTRILPKRLILQCASLSFPSNREAPIAADMSFRHDNSANVRMLFDFRQSDEQIWTIDIETDKGSLVLTDGGGKMHVDGTRQSVTERNEYEMLYSRFAELIHSGQSDVDVEPLQIVADAFLLAKRLTVDPFDF